MMKQQVTLTATINALQQAGYTLDFNVSEERMTCHQTNATFSPEDFNIDEVFRFEGDSNPDDQAVLYAISSTKFDIKGILVNGYGISADEATDAIVKKLSTQPG